MPNHITLQDRRTALLNDLHRRRKTIVLAMEKVDFLNALARPLGYSGGEYTEIDGDAISLLRGGDDL